MAIGFVVIGQGDSGYLGIIALGKALKGRFSVLRAHAAGYAGYGSG